MFILIVPNRRESKPTGSKVKLSGEADHWHSPHNCANWNYKINRINGNTSVLGKEAF